MANPLLLRSDVLQNTAQRLKEAALPYVEGRVYLARVAMLPKEQTPAVLLYAHDMDAEPLGAAWEWPVEISLALEIQDRYDDRADRGDGHWAQRVETISWRILEALMGCAEWRRLWIGPPSISCRQFLRGGDGADVPMVGETITLRLKPRRPMEFPLVSGPLDGIGGEIKMVRQDGTLPSDPDLVFSVELPEK